MLAPWKKSYDKPGQCVLKKQRHHFANKGSYSQSYVFSSSHVWMWNLDHKEGWAQKNWCFQIVVLEKTFESPLDSKKIKPINPKGNQPWIWRDWYWSSSTLVTWWAEPLETGRSIGKDPDAEKDWGQEGKGVKGWDGWMDMSLSKLQEVVKDSLVCCNPWSCKESDTPQWLNYNN